MHAWFQFCDGVDIDFAPEEYRLVATAPHARVILRISDPALGYKMAMARQKPVRIPESLKAIQVLVSERMAVMARHQHLIPVLVRHAGEALPVCGGEAYGEPELRAWRAAAQARRFSDDITLTADTSWAVPRPRSFPAEPEVSAPVGRGRLESLVRAFYRADQRPYPSAGALYPVELHAETSQDGAAWCFSRDGRGDFGWRRASPAAGSGDDPVLAATPARLWFTAMMDSAVRKYGQRAYRYALIEVGQAAQWMAAVADRAGLDCRPFGGFDDQRAARSLKLPEHSIALHCVALRRRPAAQECAEAALEVTATAVQGAVVHYATAWGPAGAGRERAVGQAVAPQAALAAAKAISELNERLALASGPALRNSNGMAAHPLLNNAKLQAALELYERHCFLATWYRADPGERVEIPASTEATVLQGLCGRFGMTLSLASIADARFGIPAVIAVANDRRSGAFLCGSCAAPREHEAALGALSELLKSVVHRARKDRSAVTLFPAASEAPGILSEAWHHEAFFAHAGAPPGAAAIMAGKGSPRPLCPVQSGLGTLLAAVTFERLPPPRHGGYREVVRATSNSLVPAEFGHPSPEYRALVTEMLGVDPALRWPHPLG